jgi:ParB-like chromosome segregation protein Spo0J
MQRPIDDLITRPPFSELFPIKQTDLAAIEARMREFGYDPAKPIDIWEEHDVVVDGHTRLEAAKAAGLPTVEVYEHDFPDEGAALEYAIRNQRDRRNLTDADLFRCIAALDERCQGARTDLSPTGGKSGAAHTAAVVGTSQRTVERVRVVQDHAVPETREAVLAGNKPLRTAYEETQAQRRRGAQAPVDKPTPSGPTQRRRKYICWRLGMRSEAAGKWAKDLHKLDQRHRRLRLAATLPGHLRGLDPDHQQQLLRDIRTVEAQLGEIATAIESSLPHDDQH